MPPILPPKQSWEQDDPTVHSVPTHYPSNKLPTTTRFSNLSRELAINAFNFWRTRCQTLLPSPTIFLHILLREVQIRNILFNLHPIFCCDGFPFKTFMMLASLFSPLGQSSRDEILLRKRVRGPSKISGIPISTGNMVRLSFKPQEFFSGWF